MGSNKKHMTHVQGWLNPNNEDDKVAIEAREYFKSKGDWSDRQLISTAFAMLMEYDKTGEVAVTPPTSEVHMLQRIMTMLTKMMGMMGKMKAGYVVTEQDQKDISDAQRQIADETLNYVISAPTEFDIDDDDESW